jgi:hypothetical protein
MIQKIGLTTINNHLAAIEAKVTSSQGAIEQINKSNENLTALLTSLRAQINVIDSNLIAEIKAASNRALELIALKSQLNLVHSDLLSQTKAILDKFKK